LFVSHFKGVEVPLPQVNYPSKLYVYLVVNVKSILR
jgi:hypothetical protein